MNKITKVACYVDGFNLYHAIDALNDQRLKWLNLRALAQTRLRDDDELRHVVYFTAHMEWEREKNKRHREYVKALKSAKVECISSNFTNVKKYCKTTSGYCNFKEEKKTDVALATRIFSDCVKGEVDRVILVTADSDQVPVVAAIRGLFPSITISLFCPPHRASIAHELRAIAHDCCEITPGRLAQCLFPRNIVDMHGRSVAISPAKYQASRF